MGQKIELQSSDIRSLETALNGWQTMGVSISTGERGVLGDLDRRGYMEDELKAADDVLARVSLSPHDLNLALHGRTEIVEIDTSEKLGVLMDLGVEMMRADVPMVRSYGAKLAVDTSTEKLRRSIVEATSMESLMDSVRRSIRATAEEHGVDYQTIVKGMAPSLLQFRVDGADPVGVEEAVVTILASRLIVK